MEGSALTESILQCFQRFRDETDFCDIFFRVENSDFDLHSVVLATRMEDYIKAHTTTGRQMKGGGSNAEDRIIIDDLPGGSSSFREIVKFCYGDSSFTLNMENVASLHYAAGYFGMLGPENLSSRIDYFLEYHVLGDEVQSVANAMELYQSTVALEETHRLSNDFSRRCMQKIAAFISDSNDGFIEEFSGLLDRPSAASIIEVAREQQLPSNAIANFVAKVVIQNHENHHGAQAPAAPPAAAGAGGPAETLQRFVQEIDVDLIREDYAATLMDMDEHLFSFFEHGRMEFIQRYLNAKQATDFVDISTPVSLRWGRRCLDLYGDNADRPPEDPREVRCLLQILKSLVLMLLSKLESADEERVRLEWVQAVSFLLLLLRHKHKLRGPPTVFQGVRDTELCHRLEGAQVNMIWNGIKGENRYSGRINAFNPANQTFHVSYDDGDQKNYSLSDLCDHMEFVHSIAI
mmetsp:Transcript_4461/g.7331  ORF Transcript_4461/g.7331 Transcript_4461/m.7331 type:complete len:462 (-) Transcript_4461:299-1684(-)